MALWCYFILPVVLLIGLLRKCRERIWGRCKSTSNLQDQVFLVTGANSGINKETAKELARRKATVIMACRDVQSAKNAIAEIRSKILTGELIPMELDLASISSIREFANKVLKKSFYQIHVFDDAGVYAPLKDHALTKDGFEIHFGVNHLGDFLLTNLLLDRLKEHAPSRIVVVTSNHLESGVINFPKLNGEKGTLTRHFTQLEICNLYPNSLTTDDLNAGKKRWEMNVFEGEWVRGVTAGGCKNFLETYCHNPQYRITLDQPDDDDDECTVIVALMQKNRRAQRRTGADCLTIGFAIYHLEYPEILPKPLDVNFFKYNASVGRSPAFINLREVTYCFKLPPGVYCIVPSTFYPNEEGEFLLRIFSENQNNMEENDDEIGIGEVDDRVREEPEEDRSTEKVDACVRCL